MGETAISTLFQLSPQQEHLWAQQDANPNLYFAECEIRIEGALNPELLRDSIEKTIERHESLRTAFERQPGFAVPFQVIQENGTVVWRDHSLIGLTPAQQTARISELSDRVRVDPELRRGPLVCAILFAAGPQSHVLRLFVPGLLADRRSLVNVAREIAAFYSAPNAADEVMQYVDIVEFQRELLAGESSKAGRDFWRQHVRSLQSETAALAAFETPLAARALRGDESPCPAVVVAHLEASLSAMVSDFCAAESVSESDLFLACWHIFLWRMTGNPNLPVAAEFDGRKYAELESAVGLFSRYLPVRTEIVPEIAFRRFLNGICNAVADVGGWQDAFSWASVGNLDLPIAFDYAELISNCNQGSTQFCLASAECRSESFELKLSVRAGDTNLLRLEFDSARLAPQLIERWSRYLAALISAAVTSPDTPISHLSVLDSATADRILLQWNDTKVDFGHDTTLHQLFEWQAISTPDRVAVRSYEDQLTYRELNERANRLAHALRLSGSGAGALVALCLDRGVDMIVALLGVFKAGAAYVPLTAEQPKLRLAQQLTNAAALITEEKFLDRLPSFGGKVLCMDRQSWQDASCQNPEPLTDSSALAYVIYTSGSTGVPKGVAIRHANLVNYALFIHRTLERDQLHETLRFATVSTLAADLGNTSIYPSLISGGCLDVIPYDVSSDSQRLTSYAEKHPYDVLKIVPSHLAALLEAGAGRQMLPRKFLITGGEALSRVLLDTVAAQNPTCEIINHYGPTETTVGSLTLSLKDFHPDQPSATIPIGKPIANTAVYVLDSRRQLVPPGVSGELYIAGKGVSAGYLDQPERTAERFIPCPFPPFAGETMYRTGDLVRQSPDGNVEFLGRADDQVKIRGFRVELGDVETALAAHEGVRQAVVIARSNNLGEKRLLGYVVPHREQNFEAAQLRNWLKERLPEHMIPAAIIALPRLPLTGNGKVDRQNLPEPVGEQTSASGYSAPESPSELLIAGVWCEVLRRERVGLDDNFFDIGGHSLLATQVVSRLRRSMEVDLQLRAMFDAPTVRRLAAWIDRARRENDGALPPPPVVPAPRDRPLPLSFIQQRLWVIDRLQPGNPVYNIPRALRMKGPLDPHVLERAINEIVRRHESQRTTFPALHGEPVQAIAPSLQVPLDVNEVGSEDSARKCAREEALQPFDLQNGPLIRTKLLRLAPDDHVFLLTVHHIISDGWSAGIFLRELSTLYEAFSHERHSPLPELTVQCADYAVWQREWLRGDNLRIQTNWWREHLRGAPPVLELPTDRPRPDVPSFAGASEIILLAPELTAAVKATCQRDDVTPFIVTLAVYQMLLGRYTREEHIVTGTDVANRTSVEVEALIGCFINVLALHTDLSGDPTFRELLARVRKVALGAWAHQDMPFDKLVEELQPERSLSHNPIVQVLFVMQNVPSAKREIAGLELISFPMPVRFSKFDLALFMVERDDQLVGNWVYRTDLFDRETILRTARQYETLLRNAVAQPDSRLSALDILTAEEKAEQERERKSRKQLHRQSLMGTKPRAAI